MGEIQFSCPHCQAKLHVGQQHVGRAVKCAKCGQVSTVPAGPAAAAPEEQVVTAEDVTSVRQKQSFAAQLARAFTYPFKGSGILMLVIATALIAGFGLLSRIICVFALLQMAMSGYVTVYYVSIIGSSAAGEEELPDWLAQCRDAGGDDRRKCDCRCFQLRQPGYSG